MKSGSDFRVECPFCHGTMQVDRESGKIVQKWVPSSPPVQGDRMKAAMEKLQREKEKRENYFSSAQEAEEKKKKELRERFEKEKERIKKEGDTTPPPRPFDLD
ncbi:MAG: hypothetical protein HY399_07820 [Elusimicrobia bacterium]|nr:hypothetical protein [Elusimicrobiota bacterium]